MFLFILNLIDLMIKMYGDVTKGHPHNLIDVDV